MQLKRGYNPLRIVPRHKLSNTHIGGKFMALQKDEISTIVKEYGANEKDTGSAEVQIALLSKRIAGLTDHLKANAHDFCSKRALYILVGKRSGLLTYLNKNDHDNYLEIIKKLGIRA